MRQIGLVVACEWQHLASSNKIEDKKAAARRLEFELGWYKFSLQFLRSKTAQLMAVELFTLSHSSSYIY